MCLDSCCRTVVERHLVRCGAFPIATSSLSSVARGYGGASLNMQSLTSFFSLNASEDEVSDTMSDHCTRDETLY